MDIKQRIDELITKLNKASDAYYGGQEEQMTNYEWDSLFDESSALEKETQYIRVDSPTQTISHSSDELGEEATGEKESHKYPALSLAKTKDVKVLQSWTGDRDIWLSWKLDGLTLVMTFDDGKLVKILTRGNGTIGTNITYMKNVIKGFPLEVSDKGHLVVRGEAAISYTDFEAINDTLDDVDDKYANPRNLASGTLALDKKNLDKVKERNVTFNAFTLVHTDKVIKSWGERMNYLDSLGFVTVDRELTNAAGIPAVIDKWTKKVESGEMDIPVDGLVITYDDIDYAATGSVTGHHATRAGFAYKWQDTSAISVLDHIEWSCAASIITPVAVFSPVQLEGTTVSRASLCNISELERLEIGENGKTKLEIIKANKIIPKCIAVVKAEGKFEIPTECPVCHAKTEVRVSKNSGTKTLRCTNPDCPAKYLKRFARFVSKTGMDIDGLSIQTLLAFVNKGFIHEFADIYHLREHYSEIVDMEGLGKKSCDNLLTAIEKSRTVNPVNFVYALCIPMIGIDAGKKIVGAIGSKGLFERVINNQGFDDIDGIGPEKSNAIIGWFNDPKNKATYTNLLKEVEVEDVEPKERNEGKCAGLVFVITGDVNTFKNRNDFKQYVENEGGKVTGSVSMKTAYLVNNDVESASSKNRQAKELRIPIISEDTFISLFGH
ncbi:MAG: NAD-dependent ligase [Evtepia sp.]|nr:NAD-dependent ligase [Evtepia sp.]